MSKIGAIVQARYSSSRFPGKMLKKIGDQAVIEHVLNRLKKIPELDQVILATSDHPSELPLINCVKKIQDIKIFRGSLENVLERFYQAAQEYELDTIMRICGDSPFVDLDIIKNAIENFHKKKPNYLLTTEVIKGYEIEIFSFSTLKQIYENASTSNEKEHVTYHLFQYPKNFDIVYYPIMDKSSYDISTVIDYPEDLEVANHVYEHFKGINPFFGMQDLINLYQKSPEIFEICQHKKRVPGVSVFAKEIIV